MTIRSGLNSVYALNERAIYSADEFSVNNKVDTSIYWEDKIYKERIVVLQANRLENVVIRNEPVMHNFPIMFEFICFIIDATLFFGVLLSIGTYGIPANEHAKNPAFM